MSKQPNIIIITTHDSGTHFGCYGVPTVRTPNIDSIASEGVRFDNMFSSSSICSPSRGTLLTGLWPENNGLLGLSGPKWRYELRDYRLHLSHVLQRNGYKTALYGFQHETIRDGDLGFDSIYPLMEAERRRTAAEISRAAADHIRTCEKSNSEGSPFYLQVGFFETHTPYLWGGLEPDSTYGTWFPSYTGYPEDDEELNLHIASFQASIHRTDFAVGEILQALKDTGIQDDTLILFNTDHGPELPRAKWTMFDAGLRIAFILRWPNGGISGGRTVGSLVGNVDFLPTLKELTGIEVPHEMDGRSFLPLLQDREKTERSMTFHSFVYGSNWAVRTDRYKYIRNFEAKMFNAKEFRKNSSLSHEMLFDLEKDPDEKENLVNNPGYTETGKEFADLLWSYLERNGSPILKGRMYHPFIRELYKEYESDRGNWEGREEPSITVSKEDSGSFKIQDDNFCLVVDFNGISKNKALQFYDLTEDPAEECNCYEDHKKTETVRKFRTQLWAYLEKTGDSILKGLPLSGALQASLSEYEKWKSRRK